MRFARLIVSLVATFPISLVGPTNVETVRAADSATGGADGDFVWAGVQTGTPPSVGGSDGGGCRWQPASVNDAGAGWWAPIVKTVGDVTYDLYERICPTGTTYAWIPRVGSTSLGRSASALVSARLPDPVFASAPAAESGVVGVPTWMWIDEGTWQPVSATAWVPAGSGILWARTTATPVRFTVVTQDDGTRGGADVAVIECEGRGEEWRVEFGDHATSSCTHTYRHSSTHRPAGVFVAVVTVEWETTFRSSTGATGRLEPLRTSIFTTMTVDELQALVG